MSVFAGEFDSENVLNESNIPAAFCSPKGSEKDFSLILPNSADRSFKMSTPIGGTLFQDTSVSLNDDTNNSLNDAVLNDSAASEPSAEESSESLAQRLEREERESQELAWQLMQQDNMEMYNLQLQYMQQNAGDLNDEDYQLMQALVNEAGQQVVQPLPAPAPAADGEDEEEGGESDELNESDSSNWDYERLLQLGQQLGDVKTERWRMRAKNVINSLPRKLYSTILAERGVIAPAPATASTQKSAVETVFILPCASPATVPEEENEREASSSNKKQCVRKEECACPATTSTTTTAACESERCVVCMDDYQADEEVALLPCRHFFHIPCTEGWLADHNFCPSCKTQVSATPTK